MKKLYIITVYLLMCFSNGEAQLFPNLGGQRAAISSGTFLKTDMSPRSSSMSGAQIALSGDAYAGHWNPGAMASVSSMRFALSSVRLPSGMHQSFAAFVKPSKDGDEAWGISAMAVNSGEMIRRTEFMPSGTGEAFYAGYSSAGVSYSRKLTDMFSFGLSLRYIGEYLEQFSAHTAVADLGFLYTTDFKDLRFAVTLHNFGSNSRLSGDINTSGFADYTIQADPYAMPAVFRMGISMVPIKREMWTWLTTLQVDHPGDNSANIRFGVEGGFRELLFIRGGWKINVKDQWVPTAGVGIRSRVGKHPLLIDYGVEPHQRLGLIQRIGVSFIFNNEVR
jgi:hypothetical protein